MLVNHVLKASLLVSVAASVLMAQEPPRKDTPVSAAGESHLRGSLRCKASQLIGCSITNTKNENLGEIQEIVFDSGNHRIAYAVVAFGGFLGMGEKYFAMPWRLIEVVQRGADDAPRATLGLDNETLKAAPGFDKGQWPDMADATWSKQVDDYYRLRKEAALPADAGQPKGSGADGKSGVDRAPGSKAFFHRRLGNLIGMNVVDVQRKKLADVEDLIVDTKHATVDGVLLSFGGTLGIGEDLALVPTEALKLDPEKKVFVFAAAKPGLQAMLLTDGKLPPLYNDEWLTRSRALNAKASKAIASTDGDVIAADASTSKSVPYADSYDLKKVETVKGTITTIGSVRVGDSQEERVRLRLRTTEGREMIVYAAPEGFAEQQSLGLRAGKVVEITGAPATYGSQTVLIAGSIVADGKTATLRDDQGRMTWTKN